MDIKHPFTYGYTDFYAPNNDERVFKTFQTLRNAQYTEPAEELFNNKKLDENELVWDTFVNSFYGPTPQLKYVDGYDSAAVAAEKQEESEGDDSGDDGNNGGGENEGDNQGEQQTEP